MSRHPSRAAADACPSVPVPHRPNVRHLLTAVAAACSLATGTAGAQAPAAAPTASSNSNSDSATAARSFDVEAGPLAQAINRFAAQAGIALTFDASALQGQTSPGVQGRYTVEAGLRQALSQSDWRARQAANGAYVLERRPAAAAGGTTLSEVNVTAAAAPLATTEGSGSYGARASTLFKTSQTLRQTPQPVTVLTRQFLDERAVPDLHDALQATPGISVGYTDSERITYWSRGYQIDALQVDGLTFSQSGSNFAQPDTAVVDHIEVLRGASGMLRGSGNPSATVNLVRKRPTSEFQGSASLALGSWDRRRLTGDISGPLNEAGTLRGRAVAVIDKKDFFQDVRHEDRKVIYGVVEADLTPNTTVTASLQYTDLDATGAWGNIPSNFDGTPLGLPRSTFLGADWNRWDRYNQQAYVDVQHRFDNDWKLKVSGAYTGLRLKDHGFVQSYFSRPAGATNPYLMNVSSSVYTGAASDQFAFNATANGPFELLGRKHELVFGAENVRYKSRDSWGKGGLNPLTNVDIRTWDPSSYAMPDVSITDSVTPSSPTYTRQKGFYGTARLSVTDPLTVIAGGRVSWWEYESVANPASNYKPDRQFTPYAGVVYDLNDTWSAYGSYTEIFTPQNVKDVNDNILKPITGEDYEAGLKGEFYDGRLNASISLFRINNIGKAVDDVSSPNPCPNLISGTGFCKTAAGKTRSEGFELELAGEVLPGWQMLAGYTNTRTKYVRDSSASNVGLPLRSQDPRHSLRLFSSYKLPGALQGWTVGGGAQIQSKNSVTSGAITARQGGYAVYNAMVGYRFNDRYSVQFNVNNLFDKVYFKQYAATGISNYYGDPRNVLLTLNVKF